MIINRLRLFATLFALFFLAGIAHGAGPLVIIGGELEPTNREVYRLMLAAKRGDGPLCLLATASAEPKRALRETRKDFRAALKARGETDVTVTPIALDHDHPDSADDPAVAKRLARCSGYFFTGGDPSRIVDLLLPDGRRSRAAETLYQRFERGALVAGTSAGAAMMSDPMIAGGSSIDALRHGAVASAEKPGVWLRPGMGFFRHGVIDQHGPERGRFGRLLVAVAHQPPGKRLGFGVGENTAIAAGANGLEAAGGSGVLVIDLEDARPLGGEGHGDGAGGDASLARGFEGGALWLLGDGDYYESAGSVGGPEAGKPLLVSPGGAPAGDAPVIPEDPWRGDAFYRLLVAFAATSPAIERLTVPAGDGELILLRALSFQARARRDGDGHPATVFAGPFELSWIPSSRSR